MNVYINARYVGSKEFARIQSLFPQVQFLTEESDATSAEVVIAMPDFFARQKIDTFPHLRFVQLLMAGYDNVDFSPFEGKNLVVSNAVDVFSPSIAEDVMTKIFYFNRHVRHYVEAQQSQTWSPIRKEPELTEAVVGILGTGSIGKETAKRLRPFGCEIRGWRRNPGDVEGFDVVETGSEGLERILKESDIIVIALPLTNETRHLLDQKKLSLLKPEALLINVARGAIIDQDALVQLLQEKKIRGAGLDVMTPEPLPEDHPLWKLENVYITPHNASSSPFMQRRLTDLIIHNLTKYLEDGVVDYVVFPSQN